MNFKNRIVFCKFLMVHDFYIYNDSNIFLDLAESTTEHNEENQKKGHGNNCKRSCNKIEPDGKIINIFLYYFWYCIILDRGVTHFIFYLIYNVS